MSLIEVSELSFSYSDEKVLEKVELEIEKGEIFGIVGPNGSGKTTLLRLLLGLETPDSGVIRVSGRSSGYQEMIGYVPQEYERNPQFPATVKEILNIAGLEDLEGSQIIEELDIADLMEKKFVELSGGQQQRVMTAFALVGEPEILILDEPSVGVDVQAQQRFYSLLDRLNEEENLTIILVSHDVGVVSEKTDRVALVNREICCTGSTDELPELMETAYGEQFKAFHHMHGGGS